MSPVNKTKVHRLWKEEGLQVRIHHPRTRAGICSSPQIDTDAPKLVWALDFQFDTTVDGKATKTASMIDEHTRLSVLNIVELSITAQRLTEELEKAFALWDGPSLVLRMDNGPEFILQVLQQFCRGRVGICYIPPGTPRNNGHIESFNNRLRKECLNRNYWTSLLEAKVVIEDFKDDHNHRHRHSSLSYLTPSWGCLPLAGAYAARWLPHPPTGGWLRDRLTSIRTGFRTMWSDYRGPAKTSTTRPRGTGYSGVTTYASPTRLRMPHTSPDLSIVARRQRPDQSGTSACQKRPGCAPT